MSQNKLQLRYVAYDRLLIDTERDEQIAYCSSEQVARDIACVMNSYPIALNQLDAAVKHISWLNLNEVKK